jgi:hypothetical protein
MNKINIDFTLELVIAALFITSMIYTITTLL